MGLLGKEPLLCLAEEPSAADGRGETILFNAIERVVQHSNHEPVLGCLLAPRSEELGRQQDVEACRTGGYFRQVKTSFHPLTPLVEGNYAGLDTKGILRYCPVMNETEKKNLTVEQKTTQPSITQRQLEAKFGTHDKCMEFLIAMRWPKGAVCPRCGNEKTHKLGAQWKWQCKKCAKNGYRFSPLVGTIFENTNVPLNVWFKVIFAMCHAKKGISALQIYRMIGGKDPNKKGAYRTSWYMCHRIRAAMQDPAFAQLLGFVEVDETFVGGKNRNRHNNKKIPGSGTAGKIPVIGAISRKGNVVCQMIENTDTETLSRFVKKTVSKNAELVATDEHSGYRLLNAEGYNHEVVAHSQGEYVRGVIHTGSIDSFWALLKRGIMGSFHHVSKKYLPLYINEFQFVTTTERILTSFRMWWPSHEPESQTFHPPRRARGPCN